MKLIESKQYNELPEFIQEQILREYEAEDEEFSSKDFFLNLYELDPLNQKDRENLEYHLKTKISDEGEPDQSNVDEIGLSGYIEDPILVLTNYCREGRHRIAASLKYNLKIKMYCD